MPVGRPEVERVKLGKVIAPVVILVLMTLLLAGCTAPAIFHAASTQAKGHPHAGLIVFGILSGVLLVV